MVNCLRYASYHADSDLLKELMGEVQFRAYWKEIGYNSSTDFVDLLYIKKYLGFPSRVSDPH